MEVYKIELYKKDYVIKVLMYNSKVWYPWKYKYIVRDKYPSSNIKDATLFKTKNDAKSFICDIMNEI